MMPPEANAVLTELRNAGVSVLTDGHVLVVWPSAKASPAQIAVLKQHKMEVIARIKERLAEVLPDEDTLRRWQDEARKEANR